MNRYAEQFTLVFLSQGYLVLQYSVRIPVAISLTNSIIIPRTRFQFQWECFVSALLRIMIWLLDFLILIWLYYSIGSLHSLKMLNVSGNQRLHTIPDSICVLISLMMLDVISYQLSGLMMVYVHDCDPSTYINQYRQLCFVVLYL